MGGGNKSTQGREFKVYKEWREKGRKRKKGEKKGEERKRIREKKKIKEKKKGGKRSKKLVIKFACGTHLKFTKGKKILWGEKKSNFSKNILPWREFSSSFASYLLSTLSVLGPTVQGDCHGHRRARDPGTHPGKPPEERPPREAGIY